MQAVTSIFQKHYVVICQVREYGVVELGIIENLSLKRLRTIEHEAISLKGVFDFGESIYVFLVLINSLQVNLEGAVGVQIEKKSRLEHSVINLSLDLFDRVFQIHVL